MAKSQNGGNAGYEYADTDEPMLEAEPVKEANGRKFREPLPKSAKEERLEKLLFGDTAGFFENVEEQTRELALYDGDSQSEEEGGDQDEADNEDTLGGLMDEQLFSWDSGGNAAAAALIPAAQAGKPDSSVEAEDAPAWQDSDDERLTVSLASHSRLRKLRLTEAEDVIDGREYTRRLRQQFERLHPTPEWAQSSKHRSKRRRTSDDANDSGTDASVSEDEGMDGDLSAAPLARLLQSSEAMTHDSTIGSYSDQARPLRSGTIDMNRLRDVGDVQPSTVETLSFHPTVSPPLLISSGPSGLLSMHHISSATGSTSGSQTSHNPLLTSLHVKGIAVSRVQFHPAGDRVFIGSRKRYFHVWNLPSGAVARVSSIIGNQDTQKVCHHFSISPCGRYMALVGSARRGGGVANVLDATTGQWICQARVEGRGGASDIAWWADGEGLVVLSGSGEVVEFSMKERRVIARWRDEGAVGSTVIALGGQISGYDGSPKLLGPSRWVAVGSKSGVVNIYDRSQWRREKMARNPKPKKVMEHLVTPTSMLSFTPDGQMLVMASRWKRDALKLVHLPSCTVYQNWPTSHTPLGRVASVAWASNSRLLAIGNEAGNIRLFQVRN